MLLSQSAGKRRPQSIVHHGEGGALPENAKRWLYELSSISHFVLETGTYSVQPICHL
jgi:hypothetical protein